MMKVLCLVRYVCYRVAPLLYLSHAPARNSHNAIHYDGVKGLLSGIMDANRSEYEKIHDMREFKRECNTEIDEKGSLMAAY